MKINPINSNIQKYIKKNIELNKPLNLKFSASLTQDSFEKNSINFKGKMNYDAYCKGYINYDDTIVGYDGADSYDLREEMRIHILNGTMIGDELKAEKTSTNISPIKNPKYEPLEKRCAKTQSGKIIHPFSNIQDAPDYNGIRGKTPLTNRNKKGACMKLDALKECDIETIIDLRGRGRSVCNQDIIEEVQKKGMNYFNFPIEELTREEYNPDFINNLTNFFATINKGNFYIGCANGESRTDLALGINYVCNANAQNTPTLNWLHTGNSDMSLKHNVKKINKIVEKNPEIVKSWGWKDIEEYKKENAIRLIKLIV